MSAPPIHASALSIAFGARDEATAPKWHEAPCGIPLPCGGSWWEPAGYATPGNGVLPTCLGCVVAWDAAFDSIAAKEVL